MGIKILSVGLILLGASLVGAKFIPDLVTGLLLIIGALGVLFGF